MWRKTLAVVLVALLAALPAQAAVIQVLAGQEGSNLPAVNLQTAQTGNADSTNTIDRGALRGACLLEIVSTVGSTPTVTVNILGSPDGTSFYNAHYATLNNGETPVNTALTITSATTSRVIMRPYHPWRFLKLNMSANTNVTLTTNIWCSR